MITPRKQLSGRILLKQIRKHFETLSDSRRAASVTVPLPDALMSGFAIFSLKYPSLLQFEHQAQAEKARCEQKLGSKNSPLLKKLSNLRTLYGVHEVPSDTQMRAILDEVDPDESIRPVFKMLFEPLQRGKELKRFEYEAGHYLLSIDGTGYFSSSEIHCESCMKKVVSKNKNPKTIYYHQMLGAAIVHPDLPTVIPMCSEPILKQDGHDKNDCERNACRRFLAKFREDHPKLPVIVIQDALASNTPHVKDLKDYGMRFILGVKPDSHVQLFRGLEKQEKAGLVSHYEEREVIGQKIRKRRTHRFRFINEVLLSSGDVNLSVNFIEYWETTEWTDPKGRVKKTQVHFSWVTDLELTQNNLMKIMKGGRARWKIENETFNTLKNQGYEFEHNFGHGQKHLTTVFAYLMMTAFLFDQIQEMACPLFQAALAQCVSRTSLWNLCRGLYRLAILPDWSAFLSAMAYPERWKMVPNHNTS
jgi:hypothetical protein